MSRILLISHLVDRARVKPIVDALFLNELEFLWESEGGTSASAGLARCVTFFWSAQTINDTGLLGLAAHAMRDDKAIHVLLDQINFPAALSNAPVFDLTDFKGNRHSLAISQLHDAIKARAQGIVPSPVRSILSSLYHRWKLTYVLLLIPLSVLLGVPTAIISLIPLFVGPSSLERAELAKVIPGSCASLEVFRDKFRNGYYADKASALLASPRKLSKPVDVSEWVTSIISIDAASAPPMPSDAAARVNAQMRVVSPVTERYQEIASIKGARLTQMAYTVRDESYSRTKLEDGYRCAILATARCKIAFKYYQPIEICNFQP